MGIQTVSPHSPPPDLTPSEGTQHAPRDSDSSGTRVASTPSRSSGAALGGLPSRPTSTAGEAGPSQLSARRGDALAKLARTTTAKAPQYAQPVAQAATARIPAPLTHAQIDAVRKRAQELGAMEAELAALRQPPELRQAEAAQPESEAEISRQIGVLQSKHHGVHQTVSELAQQCKMAFQEMARHGIALERKVDLLEQYQAEVNEAGPVSSSAAARGPAAADTQPAGLDRMAALNREIGLLKRSQKMVAEEALSVASRAKLRELGTWSLLQTGNFVKGFTKKALFGISSPINEPLEKNIDAWLDDWLPAQPRSRRGRPGSAAEHFTQDADDAFRHIARAASPEASPAEATVALAKLLGLLSRLECEPLAKSERRRIVGFLSSCLLVNSVSQRLPSFLVPSLAPAYLSVEDGGHDLHTTTAEKFGESLDHLEQGLRLATPRDGLRIDGELFVGSRLAQVTRQVNVLAERVGRNRENLKVVLKAVEKKLLEDLKAIAPGMNAHSAQARHDDIEEMGTKVAPHLGPVYGGMIKQLNAERVRLAKQPARAAKAEPTGRGAPVASSAGPDRNRLEIIVSRLRGAVLEYADKHRATFEQHAMLSRKHMDASDELEGIERQLDAARGALQGVREGKRRARSESAARGQDAASLEREIDAGWREALADPALSRLISPMALARALKMHVGQTPAQMRARVRNDDRTARTGTFRSGPELLRTIADIAEHELGKPDSALRASSRQAFDEIARRHPGGRINALHDHGRTIGQGVRASDAAGAPPSRTGTSQYAIDWAEDDGARISHVHPWVSPY